MGRLSTTECTYLPTYLGILDVYVLLAWHHSAVHLSWPLVVHCIAKRRPFRKGKMRISCNFKTFGLIEKIILMARAQSSQDELSRSDSRIVIWNDCCILRCGLIVDGAVYMIITVECVFSMFPFATHHDRLDRICRDPL